MPELNAFDTSATAPTPNPLVLGALNASATPLILPNGLLLYRDPQTGVHLRTFSNSLDFTVYPDADEVWLFK